MKINFISEIMEFSNFIGNAISDIYVKIECCDYFYFSEILLCFGNVGINIYGIDSVYCEIQLLFVEDVISFISDSEHKDFININGKKGEIYKFLNK